MLVFLKVIAFLSQFDTQLCENVPSRCTQNALESILKVDFWLWQTWFPGFDVSSHSNEDQERWGGRRLLQEMDNSSLEEIESEESKNCTTPGKTEIEWKKEDTQVFSPSPPPSLPLPPSRIERGRWKKVSKRAKMGNKWSPHVFCLSTLSAPPPSCFLFLTWGNPDCEVRWFPMSAALQQAVTFRLPQRFSLLFSVTCF